MENKSTEKTDIIMAGLGGMGVLLAGQILSGAALKYFNHVSWLPSYAVQKRGGLCECTVVFSDNEIASPIIDQAQTVIVFDSSQFSTFENRVIHNGLMLVESAGFKDEQSRNDYNLEKIPGMEIAVSMGEGQINNLILLGTYVGMSNKIPSNLIEDEMETRFGNRKAILERNLTAFRKGLELGNSKKI